jgi:hypothetical protein
MAFKLILVNKSRYGMKYPCSTIDVAPLIDYATNNQLQTKICQKPYAKTPQKTHKNLGQKSFITKQKTYERRFI